jgi:hypothetical protein
MPRTSTSNPKAWSRASRDYEAVCQHYRFHCKDDYVRQLRWFAEQRSLRMAVARAAVARGPLGARLPHQWRAPRASLVQAHSILTANLASIKACRSFGALLGSLRALLHGVPRLQEVYMYDAALRIGAFMSKANSHLPTTVYLHAGSLLGAKKITSIRGNIPTHNPTIAAAAFPHPISTFPPHEIENILCIYRRCLF